MLERFSKVGADDGNEYHIILKCVHCYVMDITSISVGMLSMHSILQTTTNEKTQPTFPIDLYSLLAYRFVCHPVSRYLILTNSPCDVLCDCMLHEENLVLCGVNFTQLAVNRETTQTPLLFKVINVVSSI